MRHALIAALLAAVSLCALAEPPPESNQELPRIEVQGKGGRPVFPYKALQV